VVTIELLLVVSSVLLAVPGIWLYFNGNLGSVAKVLAARDHEMPVQDCADC
jgi:hypothetical protein